MPEQRIVGSSNKIGGQRATSPSAPAAESAPPPPRRGRRRIAVTAVLVVIAGAGWFLLRPDSSAQAETAEVELGTVQAIDPISINLANGRYLRLGLGLQLTADVAEDVDAVKALDLAIALFSQRPIEEISTPEGRDALKSELATQLKEVYDGEVVGVYFSNFVYQ